ncbi:GATA zinc finger domain-containing protein [Mycena kentingensis (nom. inval.)]|nr:GATA zinc finger domain-containing protein [Mycena kentingensis (nom. inval.)]
MSGGNPYISKYSSISGALGPYGLPGASSAPASSSSSPYGQAYPQNQPQGYPGYPGQSQYPNTAYNPHAGGQYPAQYPPTQAHTSPNAVPGYGAQLPHPGYARPMYAPPPPHAQHPPPPQPSAGPEIKVCANCGATTTPMWRRDPATHRPLCNACGLYLQQRRAHRPPELIAAEREYQGAGYGPADDDSADEVDAGPSDGRPQCSHCHTRETSVWRRNKTTGEQVCNACGVYQRLRGKERPLSLRKDKVKPRSKHPAP